MSSNIEDKAEKRHQKQRDSYAKLSLKQKRNISMRKKEARRKVQQSQALEPSPKSKISASKIENPTETSNLGLLQILYYLYLYNCNQ